MAESEMRSVEGTTFQFRYADGTLRRTTFSLDDPIQVSQRRFKMITGLFELYKKSLFDLNLGIAGYDFLNWNCQ